MNRGVVANFHSHLSLVSGPLFNNSGLIRRQKSSRMIQSYLFGAIWVSFFQVVNGTKLQYSKKHIGRWLLGCFMLNQFTVFSLVSLAVSTGIYKRFQEARHQLALHFWGGSNISQKHIILLNYSAMVAPFAEPDRCRFSKQ